MPELPEVQTVVDDLNKKIKGHIVVDFCSDWPKAIKSANGGESASSADKFQREIKNRKILNVRRIGKNIFIDLSGGKTLYIHLKMTGHLLVKSARSKKQEAITKDYFSDKVNSYIHHIWYLKSVNRRQSTVNNQKTLEFSDVRKFAKIILDDTQKINDLKEIKSLGIDAMSPRFTFQKFSEILENKKGKKIRDVLMEQNIIAGIGNIYMSEILYEAGILPMRTAEKIKDPEKKKLYFAIKKILQKAIKLRGTSDSDYRDTSGAPGNFQKVLKVYRRERKKCEKCGTIVRRIKLGQRSAFYCPKCQH